MFVYLVIGIRLVHFAAVSFMLRFINPAVERSKLNKIN